MSQLPTRADDELGLFPFSSVRGLRPPSVSRPGQWMWLAVVILRSGLSEADA
jgi:hypothetical protein